MLKFYMHIITLYIILVFNILNVSMTQNNPLFPFMIYMVL